MILSVLTVDGYKMAVLGQESFILEVFCVGRPQWSMWYGAGNYFIKNLIHLNKTTSLNVFVDDGLPLEETLFVFITTTMVVMAGACYDKAYGTIVTFTLIYPHQFSISRKFICQMFEAFFAQECSLPSIVTEDLTSNLKSIDNVNTMPINYFIR